VLLRTLASASLGGALLLPGAFGQKKEIISLQREMAYLQEALRQLDQKNAERLAGLEALLKQSTEKQDKLTAGQAVIERSVATLDNSLAEPQRATSAKVDLLVSQFSSLRATVEEISSAQERLQGDVRDIKTHLTTLPPPTEGAAGEDGNASDVNASEAIFEGGLSDYMRGNLDLARGQFMDYLTLYPTHSRAGEAQYYLAETYYSAADYEEAVRQFDQVYKRYPLSKMAPDSLYKQGMALRQMRKRTEAEKAFQSVIDRFPDSSVARLALSELNSQRSSKPSPTL
jgi:tol-pal system protein YbgF